MILETDRLDIYLQRILVSINKIEFHTKHIDIVDIKKHPTELDACLMQLMHIGEIANKIAKKFPKFDTLPITKMIGLRNFVAHDYLGINTDIVKTIILKDLPKIKQTIKEYHWKK